MSTLSGTPQSSAKKTPTVLIAIAWLIVGLPTAWGVYNTVLNATKLLAPASTTTPAHK